MAIEQAAGAVNTQIDALPYSDKEFNTPGMKEAVSAPAPQPRARLCACIGERASRVPQALRPARPRHDPGWGRRWLSVHAPAFLFRPPARHKLWSGRSSRP